MGAELADGKIVLGIPVVFCAREQSGKFGFLEHIEELEELEEEFKGTYPPEFKVYVQFPWQFSEPSALILYTTMVGLPCEISSDGAVAYPRRYM